MNDQPGKTRPPDPENDTPSTPSDDTRTPDERDWRAEIHELFDGSFRWWLYQSDVDGQAWDLVSSGSAATQQDAVAAATRLRDENVKGSIVNRITIDL